MAFSDEATFMVTHNRVDVYCIVESDPLDCSIWDLKHPEFLMIWDSFNI